MINFYPGPSKLHPTVQAHFNDAFESGILSFNHRSPEFSDIINKAYSTLRDHLNIPSGYNIAFTSSATECWEIIIQNFIQNSSLHIYNGDFGKKWFEYAYNLKQKSTALEALPNDSLPELPQSSFDLVCLTHSETSNGTILRSNELSKIRSHFKNSLIAIDATSSMAGVAIDFNQADIWFASVQKCFGLPAGLAVMVYSDTCINKVQTSSHYNNFLSIHQNSIKNQTTHTPNTAGIYLISRVHQNQENIKNVHDRIKQQAKDWYSFLEDNNMFSPLISNTTNRSETVISVKCKPEVIDQLIRQAKAQGIILGKGYGTHKASTFRIANFPAITPQEIDTLKNFLTNFAI